MTRSLYKRWLRISKNHMRNSDNFRQAVESPESWNLMSYFCPKNTFPQLKHYIPKIYLALLSTTSVKIHQMTYAIYESISHFSLLANVHQTFQCLLKLTKLFMSFFKWKVSFCSKFGSFFSVMRDHFSVLFSCKLSGLLLLTLKFTKFFMSFLEPTVFLQTLRRPSVSQNITLLYFFI